MTGHLRADDLAPNGLFVKICGITNEADALLCVAMGTDALGFIFAAGSKRQVAPSRVTDIVKRLPPEVTTFGVFRDDAPERVIDIVLACGLNGAQLHGRESAAQTAEVASRVGVTGNRDFNPGWHTQMLLLHERAFIARTLGCL